MILFDPNISSTEVRENVAIVIAHELAHQWVNVILIIFKKKRKRNLNFLLYKNNFLF